MHSIYEGLGQVRNLLLKKMKQTQQYSCVTYRVATEVFQTAVGHLHTAEWPRSFKLLLFHCVKLKYVSIVTINVDSFFFEWQSLENFV